MEGLEDKLGALLANPTLMSQIMAMAQSLGQGGNEPQQGPPPQQPDPPPPQPPPQPAAQASSSIPNIDPGMIAQAMQLFGGMQPDSHQQALLKALRPYLGQDRLIRLERAMRAAKLAKIATGFLGNQGGNHV